jgi:hypothetical protein
LEGGGDLEGVGAAIPIDLVLSASIRGDKVTVQWVPH